MRDAFFLAVGLAATPAWLSWALGAGTVAAATAVGWAVHGGRRETGCTCGTAQGGER